MTIDLPPELEERLKAAADARGQTPADYARAELDGLLPPVPADEEVPGRPRSNPPATSTPTELRPQEDREDPQRRRERARHLSAMLEQWNQEDAADPDPEPIWEIPPLSLREPPRG